MPCTIFEDVTHTFSEDHTPDLELDATEEDIAKDIRKKVPVKIVWGNIVW